MNLLKKIDSFYQGTAARPFFRRPFPIRVQRPLISSTFDDFPKSALATGGAILERSGVSGTYYVSLGLAGQEGPSGPLFSHSDLNLALERGHELGCHTYSHCHAWETAPDVFERSILENRAALERLIPGAEFRSFSYPIGAPRPLTKSRVAKYFAASRFGGQAVNAGAADLNQLSAFFLERSRDSIQTVKDLIDRNRQLRGWLIFATHDIHESPSRFGCKPEFFEKVVRYAVNSGAHVLPVIQALERLEAGIG